MTYMDKILNRRLAVYAIFLILSISMVAAHGEEDFAQAEQIIESKVPCSQLTENQLELVGDFYMEQMHPDNHEAMDEMMGGEGSENLRLMHINMARAFYCGEHDSMSPGMMNMMMGQDIGMMNTIGGGSMMGYFNPFGLHWGFGIIYMLIFWGLVIWLTVWLVTKYSKSQKSESAIEVLKKRYAEGEITKKQFEKMKKELR